MTNNNITSSPARLTKEQALRNAKAIGFRPATIIDVGFAIGTPGLYGVFEGARHLLIEPMREAEPAMRRFCAEHPDSTYLIAAASDHEDGVEFGARDALTGSSIHLKPKYATEWRRIPTVLLDKVTAELPQPFLLKLDVEGHELHVLRGAMECLKRTEMVIAEISTWSEDHPDGRASLMDIFGFMDQHGFVLYEFVDPNYRPIDGALYVFDALFVPTHSPLRAVRKHKSKEQAAEWRRRKKDKIAHQLAKLQSR